MSTQKDTQNSDMKKNVLCELCRGKFSETQQELEKKRAVLDRKGSGRSQIWEDLTERQHLSSDPQSEHDVKWMINEQNAKIKWQQSPWCLNFPLTCKTLTWKADEEVVGVAGAESPSRRCKRRNHKQEKKGRRLNGLLGFKTEYLVFNKQMINWQRTSCLL